MVDELKEFSSTAASSLTSPTNLINPTSLTSPTSPTSPTCPTSQPPHHECNSWVYACIYINWSNLPSGVRLKPKFSTALIIHRYPPRKIIRCISIARDVGSRILVDNVGAQISFPCGTGVEAWQPPGSVDGLKVYIHELKPRTRGRGRAVDRGGDVITGRAGDVLPPYVG